VEEISQETIIAAAEGNIKAFEAIFAAHSSFVYNIALRMTSAPEDAKDITQEVFLLLHRKLGGFKFQSALKTWIYRVTVNQTITYLKSKKHKKHASYDDGMDSLCNNGSFRQDIEAQETVSLLLEKLTPEQRICVVLRNVKGLSYAEIADSVGVNADVVRSRLKRAREKLASLKKEVEAYGL